MFKRLELSTNVELVTKNIVDELKNVLCDVSYDFTVSVQGASLQQHKEMMSIDVERTWENIQYLSSQLKIKIQGCGTPEIKTKNTTIYYGSQEYYQYIKKNMSPDFDNILYFGYNDRGANIKDSYNCIRPFSFCNRLNNWLHITYDGQITLCCNDYDRQYLFGSVL